MINNPSHNHENTKKHLYFSFLFFSPVKQNMLYFTPKSRCEQENLHQSCGRIQGHEAGGGAKPSCLCTSFADKQCPRGRWSNYRRLNDELIKRGLSVLMDLVTALSYC